MDVYALPVAQPTLPSPYPVPACTVPTLAACLDAVMRSACELVGEASLIEHTSGAKIESFTNKLQTVDESSASGMAGGGADDDASLNEVRVSLRDSEGRI